MAAFISKPGRKALCVEDRSCFILAAMELKAKIQRILKVGLVCGVLILALGIANVFDKAQPFEVIALLAPYGDELLALGIIISAITAVGLLVVRQLS